MKLWALSLVLTLMLMGTGVALYRVITADDGYLWLAAVVQLTCTLVVGRIWLENKP